MTERLDFLIARDDLRRTEWRRTPEAPPAEGEARLTVERFAFTANNITYAAFGERMRYWDFFPAPEGFGRVPVWGFATVSESRAPGLEPGTRVYGYWPMSTSLTVRPERVRAESFVDASPHRAELAAVYNSYLIAAKDPSWSPEREGALSILRPLFMTSFVIEDFLSDNGLFGAGRVVLSSASSKTSLGAAFCLKRAGVPTVGLTSEANAGFVRATGYYDRVVTYAEIPELEIAPSVFVDMAGGASTRQAVHERLSEALTYSCAVGATQWEDVGGAPAPLPGPRPQLFFAPAQIKKRAADWGPGGLEQRYAPVWQAFLASTDGWLRVEEEAGTDAIERVYRQVLEGRSDPAVGHMLRPR